MNLRLIRLVDSNRRRSKAFRIKALAVPDKVCSACGIRKIREEFNHQTKTYDGRQNWCRNCSRRNGRLHHRIQLKDLKAKAYKLLGNRCVRCGFADMRALQIDHVIAVKRNSKRKTGWTGVNLYRDIVAGKGGPYQILCANCNWIKRAEKSEGPSRIDDESETHS